MTRQRASGFGALCVSFAALPDDPFADAGIERPHAGAAPDAETLWRRLRAGPLSLGELHAEFADHLTDAYRILERLWSRRLLRLSDRARDPTLSAAPMVEGHPLDLRSVGLDAYWKLSRFAFARLAEGDELRVETPRVPIRLVLHRPEAAGLIAALSRPGSADELLAAHPWIDGHEALAPMLLLLRNAGVIEPVDANGRRAEDLDPDLLQWEFHDLLFHNRSRNGRHAEPLGGHFRFKGRIEPQPAVKADPWQARSIPLARPDLAMVAAADPPFTAVLESRRSIREQNPAVPISLAQLGEFLFRSARIRERFEAEIGEFTSRPYPSGGASYELEIYLTIGQCAGLQRGFYYYDPERHALSPIRPPDADVEGMLDDAWMSAARLCRPQVLLTLASRFHRVNWKYSGMAYAAQLKNVGVLYQTLYLVATAMGLAGCALGLGNTARFNRLSQTDYFTEGSIGEFMLGSAL